MTTDRKTQRPPLDFKFQPRFSSPLYSESLIPTISPGSGTDPPAGRAFPAAAPLLQSTTYLIFFREIALFFRTPFF